jgi:hypothetical protein
LDSPAVEAIDDISCRHTREAYISMAERPVKPREVGVKNAEISGGAGDKAAQIPKTGASDRIRTDDIQIHNLPQAAITAYLGITPKGVQSR